MEEDEENRIDEMPAGREMDTLIAQDVMGDVFMSGFWLTKPDEHGRQVLLGDVPPAYSTRIAEAWRIVEREKIVVYPPDAYYASNEYRNTGDKWAADHGYFRAYADTAPLAICRVVLKAKMT
jgi:hypothetical protein